MNRFDKDIERAIQHGTNGATQRKQDVWCGINKELEKKKMKNTKRNRNSKIGVVLAAAAALLVIFTAFTPTGQAALNRFLDLFAPQKNVEIDLEGQKEENEYQLHTPAITTPSPSDCTGAPAETNKAISFLIYVDESRYTIETLDDMTFIKPLNFPENAPEVVMEIRQDTEKKPNALAQELAITLTDAYDTVYNAENVTDPLEAIKLSAHDGLLEGTKEELPQWDSKVLDIYLVDNTQGGSFIITMKYFIEATEGHGERMKAMLKEFTIIPEE